MKLRNLFIFIIMLTIIFAACHTKTVNTVNMDAILTIDLSKSYSKKKISLQSIAEIEYVALETTDDVLLDESFQLSSLSDKYIVGWQSKTDEVFVFNRNGKTVSNFINKGQSGSEYLYIDDMVFDEKNEEIFIVDESNSYRIQVYTLNGEYKRTLQNANDFSTLKLYDFDNETLLIYDDDQRSSLFRIFRRLGGQSPLQFTDREKPYMLMSKEDGTIISELNIIIPERFFLSFLGEHGFTLFRLPNNRYYGQDFVIADISSDTIYKLSKYRELTPLFVRKPSIHSTPLIQWSSMFMTEHFVVLNRASINESSRELATALSSDTLMHVFSTGETNKVSFVNDDFPSVQWSPTIGVQLNQMNVVAGLIPMSSLSEAYKGKQLKGNLQQLVATLHEEDNPVVMIVKFK